MYSDKEDIIKQNSEPLILQKGDDPFFYEFQSAKTDFLSYPGSSYQVTKFHKKNNQALALTYMLLSVVFANVANLFVKLLYLSNENVSVIEVMLNRAFYQMTLNSVIMI